MFELMDSYSDNAVIKVMGLGGGGGNAVEHMVKGEIEGVDFICANTDAQALKNLSSRTLLQLGAEITKGLGAGANPEIGAEAARQDKEQIEEAIAGADMLFVTAGMGGGTGTGAAPVVAEIAKSMGILTVAVVTTPFPFEGKKRMAVAKSGIDALSQHVDSLITIPNERLLSVLGRNIGLLDAFKAANNVLLGATQGIAELITRPGLINVDFADVRTVMAEMGVAMMGTGKATGEDRSRVAAEAAASSPLLDDVNLTGAKGILVNITAGIDLAIGEFEEVGNIIKDKASDQATVVVGTVIDPEMSDELRVTVVATGLGKEEEELPGNVERLQDRLDARPQAAAPAANPGAPAPGVETDLDLPAIARRSPVEPAPVATPPANAAAAAGNGSVGLGNDMLDIPAFLRRQAD